MLLLCLFWLTFPFYLNAQDDCSVFHEGACPLEVSNILNDSGVASNASECQALCKNEENSSCSFFTFNTSSSHCYLLYSCGGVFECQDCISGPAEPSFSECPWPPSSTTMHLHTTTRRVTRSSAMSKFNGQDECSVFHNGACPLQESNILGTSGDAKNAAECQALCKFEPSHNCNFFTFMSFISFSSPQCYLLSRLSAMR